MYRKKFYILLTIVSLAASACSPGQEKVTMDASELETAVKNKNEMAGTLMEERKELFRILLLMNKVTGYTLQLEGERERSGSINGTNMSEQLFTAMKMLREELDKARQDAAQNKELLAEIDALQHSFEAKEREISRLHTDIEVIDQETMRTAEELVRIQGELAEENQKQTEENKRLESTIKLRRQEERNAWLTAGDELIEAARMIPRANTGIFVGNQSMEITHSKQMLLKRATESYNQAIRLANQVGDRQAGMQALEKVHYADNLFNLATNYKSIGEEKYE
ncbi:MAG: hypothetical protein K5945_11550 [Bacteroidaceae bacterium]|nr:hypothetical protein [Bacteroidaceae bacterium]